MERKSFKFELKEIKETGEFEGYAAVFGNIDRGGDIIEEGAFTKTLLEQKEFPLTWFHDLRDILGIVKAEQDNFGLKVWGNLNLAVQSAKEKYALLKQKAIKAMSIGYDAVKILWENDSSVRKLKELKLYEVALVPYGMNELAEVTAVKSHDSALADALSSIIALPEDRKSGRVISASNLKLIQQASEALRALLEASQPSDDTGKGGKPPDMAGKSGSLHSLADLFEEVQSFTHLIKGTGGTN